jgi:hypothetical protein
MLPPALSWLPSFKNQVEKSSLCNSFHLSPRAPNLAMAHLIEVEQLLSRILQGHDLSEE